MAYVVTEPCRGCKYTDCVTVCPVDCFREGADMLFIDPDECICCGGCVPVCPVEAIYEEHDVPTAWTSHVELNAVMAKQCPPIVEKKEPLRQIEGQ